MIFLYFFSIFALFIVQTEDNTLHFIFKNYIDSVHISKLKNTLPSLPDISVSTDTTILPSNRSYIDNIIVTRDGIVHLENLSFTLESILNEPKIYNNVIFQTQRRCDTVIKHNTIVLLMYIDLKMIDAISLYTRIETFTYIYYPFDNSKNIWVLNNYLKISNTEYTFLNNIIAVYDTIEFDGATYMNRIWSNTQISLYVPTEKSRDTKFKFAYLIIPVIIFFLFRSKKIKYLSKEYENHLYSIHSGVYNNIPVIIKKYKKSNYSISDEVIRLTKLESNCIPKILYYENSIINPYILFECSDKLLNLSKNNLFEFINTIKYLNGQEIYYKNFNPINLRVRSDKLVLFNIFSKEKNLNLGWYSEKASENDNIREIISVGILLHYFMTGYHPYDIKTDNEMKFIFTKNKDNDIIIKKYTTKDLLEIENNIINRKYLLRTKSSLEHDLIYHTIKNTTNIRRLSKHPYFWTEERIFNFLANYSDVLEGSISQLKRLERNKNRIFINPWNTYLDETVKDELEIFRFYNYLSAKDLLRVIRNKGRHYNQIPDVVKEIYVSFPSGFVNYYLKIFPKLLIVSYNCGESLKDNELLKDFY